MFLPESKKQLLPNTLTTLILFLLMMVTGLLTSGCHRRQSSQQVNLPSNNSTVEVIPPASTAPKPNSNQPPTSSTVKGQVSSTVPLTKNIIPACLKRCSFDDHSPQGQCFMGDGVRWWGDHPTIKNDPVTGEIIPPGVFNVNKERLDTQTINGQVCDYIIPHPWRQDLKKMGIEPK